MLLVVVVVDRGLSLLVFVVRCRLRLIAAVWYRSLFVVVGRCLFFVVVVWCLRFVVLAAFVFVCCLLLLRRWSLWLYGVAVAVCCLLSLVVGVVRCCLVSVVRCRWLLLVV